MLYLVGEEQAGTCTIIWLKNVCHFNFWNWRQLIINKPVNVERLGFFFASVCVCVLVAFVMKGGPVQHLQKFSLTRIIASAGPTKA